MHSTPRLPRGVFVTGTDTGVGKTVVACALLRLLHSLGYPLCVRKPVESGCSVGPNGLLPADGAALHHAAGSAQSLAQVTPYRLRHALSPARAAQLEGMALSLSQLIQACIPQESDPAHTLWLVEGAGGLYSPLSDDGLNVDLACALAWPVLLVAPDRLGVINHVLLNALALKQRGLVLAAVILNHVEAAGAQPQQMDNAADLRTYLDQPIIRFPHHPTAAEAHQCLTPLLPALWPELPKF